MKWHKTSVSGLGSTHKNISNSWMNTFNATSNSLVQLYIMSIDRTTTSTPQIISLTTKLKKNIYIYILRISITKHDDNRSSRICNEARSVAQISKKKTVYNDEIASYIILRFSRGGCHSSVIYRALNNNHCKRARMLIIIARDYFFFLFLWWWWWRFDHVSVHR